MKLCNDCRHMQGWIESGFMPLDVRKCKIIFKDDDINRFVGCKPLLMYCSIARRFGPCYPEAKLWEPRE